jgi:hypothetical protein
LVALGGTRDCSFFCYGPRRITKTATSKSVTCEEVAPISFHIKHKIEIKEIRKHSNPQLRLALHIHTLTRNSSTMQSILYTIAIVTTYIYDANGFSTGTGSCGAGISAIENDQVGNSHIQYAGYPGSTSTRPGARGTLTEAAAILQINGVAVDPAATTSIPVGTDVTWEVIAAQVAYKGIFVRLEKSSDDFTLIAPDTATLQNVALCDAIPGVAGVSHISSALKTTSSGTINFASTGTATLDVILVFDNVANSVYAWSSFALNVEDGTPVAPSTPPPVTAPVATSAPVATPVATPSPVADTPSPVAIPTETSPPVTDPPATSTPGVTDPPASEPPGTEPPTTDECPEYEGKGKGKGGKEMGKMSKKGKKCKKSSKEGKGGKGKGGKSKGGKGKGSV